MTEQIMPPDVVALKPGDDPKSYTCIGCGIVDRRVECVGIYHCPNPFCSATGANYTRTQAGFQVEQRMTERGAALMAWLIRTAETWGAKVPKHYEGFRS